MDDPPTNVAKKSRATLPAKGAVSNAMTATTAPTRIISLASMMPAPARFILLLMFIVPPCERLFRFHPLMIATAQMARRSSDRTAPCRDRRGQF
jgi:hypothetical protein